MKKFCKKNLKPKEIKSDHLLEIAKHLFEIAK